jgi:GT2 family glycosyltransferase
MRGHSSFTVDMTEPVVSFVIPVRNDAEGLDRCLRSIRANGAAAVPIEVIVVDNGSTDASASVARRHGGRVIEQRHGSVAVLRNVGAAEAAGTILAFVDADHEIAPTWVVTGASILADPSVAAAGALCQAPDNGTWVQRGYGLLRGTPRTERDVEWLGSGNLMVRRDVFDSVAGFDTSLTTCEDVDLCNRMRARRLRIVSSVAMHSVHYGDPASLRDVLVGELWRGRDNLRVSMRSISWRGLPSVVIPILDLVMLALAVGGIAVLASGRFAGLILALAAVSVVAAAATLRVVRAAWSSTRVGPVALLQAWLVSIAYDVGRALALIARTPHRRTAAPVTALR